MQVKHVNEIVVYKVKKHCIVVKLDLRSPTGVRVCLFTVRGPVELVYLFREFGGNLAVRDEAGRMAVDGAHDSPAAATMRGLQGDMLVPISVTIQRTVHLAVHLTNV